jgi:TrmH family RNA methyltransferase
MLDNPRSPRVRSVAKLTRRPARQESGLFLLEGPQAMSEALPWMKRL